MLRRLGNHTGPLPAQRQGTAAGLGRRLVAAVRAFLNPDLVARPSTCRRTTP